MISCKHFKKKNFKEKNRKIFFHSTSFVKITEMLTELPELFNGSQECQIPVKIINQSKCIYCKQDKRNKFKIY